MTARQIQYLLSAIFLGLGSWCVIAPGSVEHLVFKPEFQHGSATTSLLLGCFGAQAVLAGILIATSEFKASTFLIFGFFGSVPFFAFNYYFYFIQEMFTHWMLLDFFGNIGILGTCIVGYRLKQKESPLQAATFGRP